MSESIDRRNFIKKSVAGVAGAAFALSIEEQLLLGAERNAKVKFPAWDGRKIPTGKIGKVEISRLICGGNLINGYAHSRDLTYVSSLLLKYFTDEKILETFEICEECGINTVILNNTARDMKAIKLINKYWNERGGKIQWMAQATPTSDDVKTNLDIAIDHGAVGVLVQGGLGDLWVKAGRVDLLAKAVDYIKEKGCIAGIAAHSVEVPKACVKANIDVDFYMKTLHHGNYWSATPSEERIEFNVDSKGATDHDNIWSICPEKTIEFMKGVEKPWIAYKVMAAGAITPEDGFKYAFENGADFIVAGMFDFQIREDCMIARSLLRNELDRVRPWYG
jgi:hypothetical protein